MNSRLLGTDDKKRIVRLECDNKKSVRKQECVMEAQLKNRIKNGCHLHLLQIFMTSMNGNKSFLQFSTTLTRQKFSIGESPALPSSLLTA
ncbi:hypothetical protein L596_009868 [Steinernema carpocapsae]|uniref:Uncharacterized protein n=1 Tax=Steinernema carpocapsae TaxID=34508 RepID=A0A4U5PHE7_STECR|nr:hypothetical protein L596_009868 [Steinernema carpocapsae]